MIQWYPGHMAKAKKMLQDNLKLTDIVVEVADARAPLSTRNPDFNDLFSGKQRVVILNKSDLASLEETNRWISVFEAQGMRTVSVSSVRNTSKNRIVPVLDEVAKPLVEKARAKGVLKTVRAIVVGIPNVGKSTMINCIAGKKRAAVGNKPGVTKGKQWVSVTKYLELMDSPGILWPKFEDETTARHLSYLNAINDDILDIEDIAVELAMELAPVIPEVLQERFGSVPDENDREAYLRNVCRKRSLFYTNGEENTKRAAEVLLDEFRSGKLGRITLETPEEKA
ncbi:MAG: ribosome biogenesis GTPase YlqF [Clostridia bacterium]|nr:ribosome biogenesis GTPase YlqF [Clostridia bacterium]